MSGFRAQPLKSPSDDVENNSKRLVSSFSKSSVMQRSFTLQSCQHYSIIFTFNHDEQHHFVSLASEGDNKHLMTGPRETLRVGGIQNTLHVLQDGLVIKCFLKPPDPLYKVAVYAVRAAVETELSYRNNTIIAFFFKANKK